jgi:hypothetical protein
MASPLGILISWLRKNMATLIFLLGGSCGIVLTITILHKVQKVGVGDHIHALILSIGLGLTWMIAPLLSIAISGSQNINIGFVIFWVAHSLFVAVLLYIFDRLYLRSKSCSH